MVRRRASAGIAAAGRAHVRRGARRAGAGLEPGRSLCRSPTTRGSRPISRPAPGRAAALEADYKGRLAELDGDGLADDARALRGARGPASAGCSPSPSCCSRPTATTPWSASFYQGVQERVNAIGTQLLFVTLELNKLDDAPLAERSSGRRAPARASGPGSTQVRSYRPHQLADEVERTLHEKHVTGRSAWVRLFDETMAALRFPLDGKELTSAEIFDLLSAKDRAVARAAATSISGVLEKNVRLFCPDHQHAGQGQADRGRLAQASTGRSRSRNLANQVEDEVVDAPDRRRCRRAYPRLSHRYYALKARWMGLDKLEYWDRNAPLPEDSDTRRPWAEAKVVVLDAYRTFSPTLADIVEPVLRGHWIDAQLRPGKDSGAFCHPTVPSAHPYVLMNYQGRSRDVMTLAHELGHGVHQVLAARAGAADGRHAADPGRDRLGVRRAAHLPCPAGAGDRSGAPPRAARGQDRGHAQHGRPPDRVLRVRAPGPRRPPARPS